MLPGRFEYHRPSTLEEALALLAEQGEDAKVLAGGQSLIPVMKLRLAALSHLVDVNRVPGLDALEESEGQLRVGALVRHRTLERSGLLGTRYPAMAAAAPQIADPIVRTSARCADRSATPTPPATGVRSCWRWAQPRSSGAHGASAPSRSGSSSKTPSPRPLSPTRC